MTDQNPDPKPDSARRKLVRGTFAAPAVLTLQCGSAFAAASMASLARQVALGETVLASDADDTYFRYRLWVIRDTGGNIVSSWIKGADLDVYMKGGQFPFVAVGSWLQFDPGSNMSVGGPTTTPPAADGSPTLTQTGAFVGLRVSSTGALVGAGASGGGGSVSDSVWNSFAVATAR